MTNPSIPAEILLIDDDIMFAEGVQHFFETSNLKVTIAATAKEMQRNLKYGKYTLALLDWNLRDGTHALESIAVLRKAKIKVIVVSGNANGQQQRMCIQSGVQGYLEKGNHLLRLLEAAQIVLQNGMDFHDAYPENEEKALLPELKEHETEMLIQYICNPLISYKQLAQAINSGESWVKECMPGICRKFGVVNREQLYKVLQQHGIIPVMTPQMATLALKKPSITPDGKSVQ